MGEMGGWMDLGQRNKVIWLPRGPALKNGDVRVLVAGRMTDVT